MAPRRTPAHPDAACGSSRRRNEASVPTCPGRKGARRRRYRPWGDAVRHPTPDQESRWVVRVPASALGCPPTSSAGGEPEVQASRAGATEGPCRSRRFLRRQRVRRPARRASHDVAQRRMMFHVEHSLSPEPPLGLVRRTAQALGVVLDDEAEHLTLAYLRELARWNATTSLIQARSWEEILVRHVAEGWVASRLLGSGADLRVLDVGSGGGVPAFPMRCLRRDIQLTLVEPRQRKAAFLEAVARLHGPPRPEVLCRRVEDIPVGQAWNAISFRGIRLEPKALSGHLGLGGRILRFPGNPDEVRGTWLRDGFRLVDSEALPTVPLQVEAWERERD